MANEWLLYGAVGVALVLGAVWLAWRYYYDRINRSLSAAGWVGWDSARASGLLRRRLRTRPELFIDRVADHPPTTPEEAAAALHLLPWAEHTGNGFGDDGKADRAAWVVIQPLLRGPPGCVRKEEYEDFLRPLIKGWRVSHPGWAAAAEFALHRHGMHPLLENVGRQCLQAWDDLTDVNRLHALEQVVATGGSSPALLGTAAQSLRRGPGPGSGIGRKDSAPGGTINPSSGPATARCDSECVGPAGAISPRAHSSPAAGRPSPRRPTARRRRPRG